MNFWRYCFFSSSETSAISGLETTRLGIELKENCDSGKGYHFEDLLVLSVVEHLGEEYWVVLRGCEPLVCVQGCCVLVFGAQLAGLWASYSQSLQLIPVK